MFSSLIGFISRLIWGKNLKEVLAVTRTVRINGVRFTFRKISTLDYLDGSKVMIQYYDEYKRASTDPAVQLSEATIRRVREHYRDVFMSAVVNPKLVRKLEDVGENVHVDEIFRDEAMANQLYVNIMSFSSGKKKL